MDVPSTVERLFVGINGCVYGILRLPNILSNTILVASPMISPPILERMLMNMSCAVEDYRMRRAHYRSFTCCCANTVLPTFVNCSGAFGNGHNNEKKHERSVS